MASIYKRPADKGKKNKPWLIEYVDHEGKRAYAKGFTDKGLTEQLAAKLENEVLLRKRGMIDPAQERLLAIKQSPITEALVAFERSLDANTPKHIRLTMTRVRTLVEASGAKTVGELDAEHVENALKAIRTAKDLGKRTWRLMIPGRWCSLAAHPPACCDRVEARRTRRRPRWTSRSPA